MVLRLTKNDLWQELEIRLQNGLNDMDKIDKYMFYQDKLTDNNVIDEDINMILKELGFNPDKVNVVM